MSNFKDFKRKLKENKGKILAGTMFGVTVIGGVVYIITNNGRLKKAEDDIQLLKDVVSDDVLYTLKDSLKRRLRYAEGKLNNALMNDNVITDEDIKMRKEEIEAITNQLFKLDKAVDILNK